MSVAFSERETNVDDSASGSVCEPTPEDPAAIVATLARHAKAVGNSRAARILESTAHLLAAAMRSERAVH